MKLEEQVVSLDLAKRLKELGVKQGSLFWWVGNRSNLDKPWKIEGWRIVSHHERMTGWQSDTPVSAYTVAELADMLPKEVGENYVWRCSRTPRKGAYEVKYRRRHDGRTELLRIITEPKFADAMAAMLIFLIESKLYEPTIK